LVKFGMGGGGRGRGAEGSQGAQGLIGTDTDNETPIHAVWDFNLSGSLWVFVALSGSHWLSLALSVRLDAADCGKLDAAGSR
jgi:hypothetical protein